jgi:hypothetical protein
MDDQQRMTVVKATREMADEVKVFADQKWDSGW